MRKAKKVERKVKEKQNLDEEKVDNEKDKKVKRKVKNKDLKE